MDSQTMIEQMRLFIQEKTLSGVNPDVIQKELLVKFGEKANFLSLAKISSFSNDTLKKALVQLFDRFVNSERARIKSEQDFDQLAKITETMPEKIAKIFEKKMFQLFMFNEQKERDYYMELARTLPKTFQPTPYELHDGIALVEKKENPPENDHHGGQVNKPKPKPRPKPKLKRKSFALEYL